MAALLTLRSTYQPGPPGHGAVTLRLENAGRQPLECFRLALTSIVQLDPPPGSPLQLARRVAGYHEFAALGLVLAPGASVEFADLVAGHTPRHANDGPASAFVILADGTPIDADVEPMARAGERARELSLRSGHERASTLQRTSVGVEAGGLPLLPWPAAAAADGPRAAPGRAWLASGGDRTLRTWQAVAAAERRLTGDSALALDDRARWTVSVEPGGVEPGAYRLVVDGDAIVVAAADTDGFQRAFITLAQLAGGGLPERVTVEDRPAHAWRGLHVDVARQFLPAAAVARLVDVAAWRKLNRFHLHLTDDEAWRVPIDGYPELTTIGAWRGHGLAIPPLLGSPAAATGGAYTADEIRSWVRRGRDLGVVIVPEVDLPGHCHAALTAVPALRDPDDATGASSVQYFVDNALYPGLAATGRFVEAVFAGLAKLFESPWLHLGGDEVPYGAWARSPVVAEYARRCGVIGTDAIAAAFVADVAAAIRRVTGRRVGAWQEAAEHGGMQPDDGYVVAWKSAADALRFAVAGYDVVLSAPGACYLDMAIDDRWESPGASWAGSVSLDDVCAFDPGAGWPSAARRRLLGIQACVWTEHIRTAAAFDELVFPRLDAIAERAWTGRIEGGAESVARRAASLPQLTPLSSEGEAGPPRRR